MFAYKPPCLSPSTHYLQCRCAYRQQEANKQSQQRPPHDDSKWLK